MRGRIEMFLFNKSICENCFAILSILLVLVNTVQAEDPRLLNGKDKECFGDHLGCFSNEPPFCDLIERPICPLPEKGTKALFMLYYRTDYNSFKYLELNRNSLRNSNFDPSLETKVVVHGYDYNMDPKSPIMNMTYEFVKLGKFNIIFVDWSESSRKPFPQAVADGRVVGAMIARILQFIKNETSATFQSMHLIGHSLGSHVTGWAGERMPGLARITALDPGGPYFYKAPPIVRIDHTDAVFVDAIHTNGGYSTLEGLGRAGPVGHIDFYPNGGSSQPGCSIITLPELRLINACSHARAILFYIESFKNSDCKFIGVSCDSWEKYRNGECNPRNNGSHVAEMGFYAMKPGNVPPGTKFYLVTNSDPPFCKKEQNLQV